MADTPGAIIRDLARLHGMGLAAAGEIPDLARRAKAFLDAGPHDVDVIVALVKPAPARADSIRDALQEDAPQ